MTIIEDQLSKDLGRAIRNVVAHPRKIERDEILRNGMYFIAMHLGLQIVETDNVSEAGHG